VKGVSFQLKRGEVLGIAGLVGAGRSELVESIFGVTPCDSGEIYINGKQVHINHPQKAVQNKLALITEDRKLTGLNLIESVKENISMVSLSKLSKNGVIDSKKENAAAEKYINALNIKVSSTKNAVSSLSGGNQQKVVLAKWLLSEPDIIIFDEPTRGIDVGAKHDIYVLISELAKSGKGVIVISSEMPEIMGISDRIMVMCEGRITGELKRDEFSQEIIMQYASTALGGNN
jgi:ABC-type sugar transport system ATPase subunit